MKDHNQQSFNIIFTSYAHNQAVETRTYSAYAFVGGGDQTNTMVRRVSMTSNAFC